MQKNFQIKVLFVIDTLEGYGAEKSIVEIAKNLNEVLPVFVHIYKGDMLKNELEDAGIKVHSLNLTNKYGFNLAVEELQSVYLQEKPDIIHATLYRSEIITRKLKAKFPEIKLIGSLVSNAYSENRYFRKNFVDRLKLHFFYRLERKTLKEVDLFISNSYTIKETTCKALKIPKDRVEVVYRGRNTDNYTNFTSEIKENNRDSKEEFVLLNVSRLIPLKGQLDLIRAMPKVVEQFDNIELIIAGDGYYNRKLENEVRHLKLQEHVKLIGRTNEIQNYLRKADVFVYPSYSEGLPGALIEAMMAGKIIIASDIPENLECVGENSAVIFKKGDIRDLSEKILIVLENLNTYHQLGEFAQKTAFKKFDVEEIAKSYASVYKTLLK